MALVDVVGQVHHGMFRVDLHVCDRGCDRLDGLVEQAALGEDLFVHLLEQHIHQLFFDVAVRNDDMCIQPADGSRSMHLPVRVPEGCVNAGEGDMHAVFLGVRQVLVQHGDHQVARVLLQQSGQGRFCAARRKDLLHQRTHQQVFGPRR